MFAIIRRTKATKQTSFAQYLKPGHRLVQAHGTQHIPGTHLPVVLAIGLPGFDMRKHIQVPIESPCLLFSGGYHLSSFMVIVLFWYHLGKCWVTSFDNSQIAMQL